MRWTINGIRSSPIEQADRLDRRGRMIFVVLAIFIVVVAGSYFFVSDDVEINPGKKSVDNTSTQTTPVRTGDQQ